MLKRTALAMLLAVGAVALARAAYPEFEVQEAALNEEIADAGDPDAQALARLSLARFYATAGLHVEAIAALGADWSRDDDERRMLAARAAYALGRWREANDLLADERLTGHAEAAVYRAMTAARLGAYEQAGEEFARADMDGVVHPDLRHEAMLLKAETDLARGELAAARRALEDAEGPQAIDQAPLAQLLRGAIALESGDSRGLDALRALSSGDGPIAARAALRVLICDIRKGAVRKSDQQRLLVELRLRSSGPTFEREWLAAAAHLAADAAPGEAIDALRRLAINHPQSDQAVTARAALAKLLAQLVSRADMPPRVAARLFYENIEFAPRGAEGDELIRSLADKLAKLDLFAEAAELLEHQIYHRLRGALRSKVAADLAEIRLEEGRPAEALQALRATRFAGLDAPLVQRRHLLEARALERFGAYDAALELLADEARGEGLELRAEVEWRTRRFAAAAASYRQLALSASGDADKARNAALRAAAGYLLANDAEALALWRRESSARLEGVAESDLVNAMGFADAADGEAFLAAYRRLFSVAG